MATLQERFRFFAAHAGYRVGYRAVVAMALARAERRAELEELECKWEDEIEPWDGECPAPRYLFCGMVETPTGEIASLGMVGVDSLRDPYLRVVAAELFDQVFEERDERAEHRAAHVATVEAYTARDAT